MNPEECAESLERSELVRSMRSFMDAHGFIEVETPMMHPVASSTAWPHFVTHHNTLDSIYISNRAGALLKRLVVGAARTVFEINRNFRNEGSRSA